MSDEMIEYRCLDCGKRFPYGMLAKERLDTCPVCGYELVPLTEAESGVEEPAYPPGGAGGAGGEAYHLGIAPSAPRLIGIFVGVSGLIFALAL